MKKIMSLILCVIPVAGFASTTMACESMHCNAMTKTAHPIAWLVPSDATPQQACSATGQKTAVITELQDNNGQQMIVCSTHGSSMVEKMGPPPSFKDLDQGHKGYLTEKDAEAYPPLANDFLDVSHETHRISRASYENWVRHFGE